MPDADLDDALQEVMLAMSRKKTSYDPQRSLRAWSFGFAMRISRDHRRRLRRRGVSVELDELRHASTERDPERQLSDEQACALLMRALDSLDDEDRAIVTLIDLEEMSAPEAAEILELPLNTAYTRLRRARAKLANCVRARSRCP